jgi:hypothetical protein
MVSPSALALISIFRPCSRVGLVVYLGEVLEVKVSIDLCCGDIRVPQQFLDTTQVVAGFEQVCGE